MDSDSSSVVVKELEEFTKSFKEAVQDAMDKSEALPRSSLLLDESDATETVLEALSRPCQETNKEWNHTSSVQAMR